MTKRTSIAHYLGGLLTMVLIPYTPVASVLLFIGFMIYETDEGFIIKDASYKDIKEFLLGMVIGSLVLLSRMLIPWVLHA